MRRLWQLYGQISICYRGKRFYAYQVSSFTRLLRWFRSQSDEWAIFADIGGVLPDGSVYIHRHILLASSKDWRHR